MKFNNVVIQDFAYTLPPQKLTSEGIERELQEVYGKLKLPTGRLELMTGIEERRFWELGTPPSSISAEAAEALFSRGNIKREEIDLLIHASVCRDCLEPSTAAAVHNKLGLSPSCTIFDLSNACLGVLNSIVVAGNMIESGQIEKALIVSGENGGPLLFNTLEELKKKPNLNRKNIKKYIANLTIGSAGVAYLLTHKRHAPEAPKILGGAVLTDSSAVNLCRGDGNPTSMTMETDSEALLKAGIPLTQKTWQAAKEELAWNNETPDWVIGHQVGIAHEKLVLEALGLIERPTYKTYPFLGNTGSAALPITLAMLDREEKKINKGQKLALLGIGSGLSSIMLGVEW
ncbi:MAG: 3-oxoacyl-ACP synthase III [Halobacteriovoraceae bacterium]|jgi:acyl-CoA:acyl-CoA alkyltransferase|nr:3-oxoacyl-ACP synthase III [Halobacteriovoraceae bacterium]